MPPDAPIGLFGGMFDPPHNGHLATAKRALDYFALQKVIFIPAGNPPHKAAPHAAQRHRMAMLRRCVQNEPGIEIWDGELRRKGPSYTLDTLKVFARRFPRTALYFIIGSDNLREIPSWHEYRAVLARAVFCVAHRPGFPMDIPDELSGIRMKIFESAECDVSSTMIRSHLKEGKSCESLLPSGVLDYIREQGLYRE